MGCRSSSRSRATSARRRARCPSSNCAACAAPRPRSGSISSARISCAWAVSATGFNPYITMDPAYDAAEIGVLRNLVERGYVYRGLRPVHWCFADRTALAEAEVEYREHVSPSIYVAFALNAQSARRRRTRCGRLLTARNSPPRTRPAKLFAVIWTTTPWTLPANLGISLNATLRLRRAEGRRSLLHRRRAPGRRRREGMRARRSINVSRSSREALKSLDGQDIFRHPFVARDGKLMFGDHVTADAGTGLVHTAPGPRLRRFRGRLAIRAQAVHAGRHGRRFTRRWRRMGRAERLQGQRFDRRETAAHSARCSTRTSSRTAIRIAGAARIR